MKSTDAPALGPAARRPPSATQAAPAQGLPVQVMFHGWQRPAVCVPVVVLLVLGALMPARGQPPVSPKMPPKVPPPKVAAGTVVDQAEIAGWTHRVLIARPRVAAGDVAEVSATVRRHAERFSFVLLARVQQDPDQAPPAFVLQRVGVALAAEVGGRLRVVSGAGQPTIEGPPAAAVDLGFIANTVLHTAEQSLDQMRVVVRRSTLVILDSPAVIHLNGVNQVATVRSMLWVDPPSGRLQHAIWALQSDPQGAGRPALPEGRYLAVPLEEDRILHVDGDQFTLGIPTATAFALAGLPPGRRFSLRGPLGNVACRPHYDDAALRQLAEGLVGALRRGAEK